MGLFCGRRQAQKANIRSLPMGCRLREACVKSGNRLRSIFLWGVVLLCINAQAHIDDVFFCTVKD